MTTLRRSTVRDVAREAGMSISTVSRALRCPELLRPDTRRRIDEAIAKLHYQPSITAQNLRASATNLILVIVPSLSPFFLEIFRGVEEAAAKAGYNVLVGDTDRDARRERQLIDQVAARRADGAILVTSVDLAGLSRMQSLPPLIIALDVDGGTALPTVRVDHVAAAAEATRYLLETGHRAIAHISGPPTSGMTAHRIEGYRQALREAGLTPDPQLLVEGAFTVESGSVAMEQLLERSRLPSAIFAANDQMAIGAIRTLRAAGLRVPDDVAVMGFDDERIADLYDPPLSTVRMPTFEVGFRSMEQMVRLLAGEPIASDVMLETELAIRRSTSR